MGETRNFENRVELTEKGVLLGGKPTVLLCGSLFYFRLPRAVWRDRIAKLKACGYNCVDVYFPWNYHEKEGGGFDFSGEKDVRFFLRELKRAGLYVVARPGPYICSEWNGGGIPARVLESDIPIRCADERFLAEVGKWYDAILAEIAPFTYGKGGTVILLQLENELDFYDCPDPQAYISRLYELARARVDDIPCFCCAGQYDLARAGGLGCANVAGTLNCYPESLDPTFDAELQGYAFRLGEKGLPLLVSETNRDHFLLRRELSCGSKLLGAYNQVAGSNFDHFQALNNWGSPDSFIMTVYDFWSMVDPIGAYRPEAEEAALFAAFLRVTGEALGGALPLRGTVIPERCDFVTAKGGLRVLSLCGGGYAVCVPNFSEKGSITFSYGGRSVTAEISPRQAPFFLFGFDLFGRGIPAKLTRANCEPILAEKKRLVFVTEGKPCIGLDFGDGEQLLTADGTVNGVSVHFAGREEALSLIESEPLKPHEYTEEPYGGEFRRANLPARREVSAENGLWFGAMNVREGMAEYAVTVPVGRSLFVEHPCDILRVSTNGVRGDTLYSDGRDRILPPSPDGKYLVEIEKWGHSNFDDSQSPAIRIACKKGATYFGAAEVEEIERCDFRLLSAFGEDKIELTDGIPVRIGVSKWNSTRKPVICSYTVPVTRKSERLLVKTTEKMDVAVYVDGAKVGMCEYGTFELTAYIKKGETRALTLVYRKQVWTQDSGSLRILHIDRASSVSVRVRTAKELGAISGEGEAVALPLPIDSEVALSTELNIPREGFLRFKGNNVKLTCVVGGRVVGRLLLNWEHAPSLQGGDPDLLYVCPAWNGKMYLLAEALGHDARLDGADYLSAISGQPDQKK